MPLSHTRDCFTSLQTLIRTSSTTRWALRRCRGRTATAALRAFTTWTRRAAASSTRAGHTPAIEDHISSSSAAAAAQPHGPAKGSNSTMSDTTRARRTASSETRRGEQQDAHGHGDARRAHAHVRTIGTWSRTGTDTVRRKDHHTHQAVRRAQVHAQGWTATASEPERPRRCAWVIKFMCVHQVLDQRRCTSIRFVDGGQLKGQIQGGFIDDVGRLICYRALVAFVDGELVQSVIECYFFSVIF